MRTAATPWRDPGPVSPWLVAGVPVATVAWSRLTLTWFLAPSHLLLVGLGWLVLATVVAVATARTRSWHVATAVGGAVVVRSALLLAVLAVRGPGGYWFAFWTEPGRRSAYVVLAVLLAGWVLASLIWSLGPRTGGRRAAAVVLGTCGAVALAVGLLLTAVGLEDALTVWNDQLALLPWGMARILGITTFLGIPSGLPVGLLAAGGGMVLAAVGLGVVRRRPA